MSTPSGGGDPLVGRLVADRFKILSLIATGGMGRVYRAEQVPLGRLVALKVLSVKLDAWDVAATISSQGDQSGESAIANDKMRERFLREASICAKLKHPNTITIFDYGAGEDNIYFIAMELLEGRTLAEAIAHDGPFEPTRALRVAGMICRALKEAHGHGVIHRDLKPGNIFLVRNDEDPDFAKVLDFGLVKAVEEEAQRGEQSLTQTGTFVGSPCYVSPEQVRNVDVDARTDIYSLGVILCQMLTGKVPFEEKTAMDTVLAHLTQPVPPLSSLAPHVVVPAAIETVIQKCLSKKPDDRYDSMESLYQTLQMAAAQSNLPSFGGSSGSMHIAHLPSASGPQAKPKGESKRVGLYLGAGLVAAAVAAGVVVMLPESSPESDQAGAAAGVTANGGAAAGVAGEVSLQLRSTPHGAQVLVGERVLCEATPCDVFWKPDPSTADQPTTFRFTLTGHLAKEIVQAVAGPKTEVTATLSEAPGASDAARRKPVAKPVVSKPAPVKAKPVKAEEPEEEESDESTKTSKPKRKRKAYKDNPY